MVKVGGIAVNVGAVRGVIVSYVKLFSLGIHIKLCLCNIVDMSGTILISTLVSAGGEACEDNRKEEK